MARSSQFGGDVEAVAANTPTPAAQKQSIVPPQNPVNATQSAIYTQQSTEDALNTALNTLKGVSAAAESSIKEDVAANTGTTSNSSIVAMTAPAGGGSGGDNTKATLTGAQEDAYQILIDSFNQYGLSSLVPTIKGYMQQALGPQEAAVKLKTEPAYITRFAGNYGPNGRVANGLNA
jgi:hypothetical protein